MAITNLLSKIVVSFLKFLTKSYLSTLIFLFLHGVFAKADEIILL